MKKIQSSYDYDDLIISGEESLFGDGNAQLPLPPMLMFDRITHIANEGGALLGSQSRVAGASAAADLRARGTTQ